MATRHATVLGQLRHMKDIPEEHPMLVKFTGEDFLPKPGESVRLVDLVSVHAENPCGRTRKVLDEGMGFRRMPDGSVMDLRQLAGESVKNLRRAIGRAMIGHVDFIAKTRDVPHCGFDKGVLVADEGDSDNA
jgi:hypothetical protein